jgi:ketosteroid isomerase-like protein
MSAAVALAFNDAITTRSLDDLALLMTDDHRFVDSSGAVVEGKAACLDAWRGFFDAYPDYENRFEEVVERADVVAMRGRSHCSTAILDGPAMWTARVRDGLVAEWRVYDDSDEEWMRLTVV